VRCLQVKERAEGLILACRAHPKTDVTVEWLAADFVAEPPTAQQAVVWWVKQMTHDILAIRLELENRPAFKFAAGQYLQLTVAGAPARSYSMASLPGEELVEIHVRLVPGGRASTVIHNSTKPGDLVQVEGPSGSAYLREAHEGPMIAIAGGSGLAPIKSIVGQALEVGKNEAVHVYFGARTPKDLYLMDYFKTLERRHSNLRFIPVLSLERAEGCRDGYVANAIAQDWKELTEIKAYVAGPPAMVDAVGAVLTRRGVATADIHADVFFTPEEQPR
jgi:CDP-4-dehydro-6-deoxyglucose reductase